MVIAESLLKETEIRDYSVGVVSQGLEFSISCLNLAYTSKNVFTKEETTFHVGENERIHLISLWWGVNELMHAKLSVCNIAITIERLDARFFLFQWSGPHPPFCSGRQGKHMCRDKSASPHLASSIGSMTLCETTYNKANCTIGQLIKTRVNLVPMASHQLYNKMTLSEKMLFEDLLYIKDSC